MTTAYVALGSNLGDPHAALRAAIQRIGEIPDTRVIAVADFRQTTPVDCPPGTQPFLNSVLEVQTSLDSEEFMKNLMRVETELGRQRGLQTHAPRIIDLDLLLFGQEVRSLPDLTIPHPRMHLRRFVLEPLVEIAPEARHPVLAKTARELLAGLHDNVEGTSP